MQQFSLPQRAKGHLATDLKRRGTETVIADLRQDGCMKARFPRPVGWTEIVTLNSSGGIAGGDWVSTKPRDYQGPKVVRCSIEISANV